MDGTPCDQSTCSGGTRRTALIRGGPGSGWNTLRDGGGVVEGAQSFTATRSGTLRKIQVGIQKLADSSGNTADWSVQLVKR